MKVQEMNIEDVKPYENNPRDNDGAVDAVANSIKDFGWQQPIVIDKDNIIVAGHTRYKAAKQLGLKDVPVVYAKHKDGSWLTDQEVKAFRLADNKSGELADWNFDELNIELDGISDFDMTDFGFDKFDLNLDVEDNEQVAVDDDFEEDVPEEPKSKLGQIYKLGRHRLMCGDGTKPEDVEKLMGGYKADLLLTDPPYNVAYEGKQKNNKMTIKNDNQSDDKFYDFLFDAFNASKSNMKPGSTFYIWYASAEAANFNNAANNSGLTVREELIWEKNQLVMGRQDYQWKHEPCLYGWADGGAHSWYSDRKQTTVLHFDKPKRSDLHPTMKPVPLFDYQLKNSSKSGDIVLDLFGGSGTTLMACEQNGRNAYLMEYDPKYVDVIIDRWEKFTGQKATLIK